MMCIAHIVLAVHGGTIHALAGRAALSRATHISLVVHGETLRVLASHAGLSLATRVSTMAQIWWDGMYMIG